MANVGRQTVEIDPSGRYKRYDTIIGEGAMKKVYLGLDGIEGKVVAWSKTELTKEMLKNKRLLQSLCTEAELMKVLRHDNIVTCYESWIDHKDKFINMITEYLPPGNLGEYVRRHNPVERRVIREWCKQILRGLDYLHTNNIIHRDLSTDNIFIDGSSSTLKIGDLGLGLMFQYGACVKKFSCRPEFMAPELLIDDEDYSQLIDIYSFGMCVLQMVTRETLYDECVNKFHIRAKVKTGVMPKALGRVQDEAIKDFIMKCLSFASKRPNARELLKDSFIESNDSGTKAGSSSQSKTESKDKKQKGPAEILGSNDSNTEAGSSSQSKTESKDKRQEGAAEILPSNDSNTEAGSSSKSESEDKKKEVAAEILPSNVSNTEAGSSSPSKSESEGKKQEGAAEIPPSNDSNTEAGSSSPSKSESEGKKQEGAAEIPPSNDSNTEAGSSSPSKSESEDKRQEGAAEIPPSNDSNTEAGSSSQSKSESEDKKQKGPAEILGSNDSNTETGSSSQSKSESEDKKQEEPAENLPLDDSHTEVGSSSQNRSESEDKKQKGPAEILPSNDSNTEAGSSSQGTSEFDKLREVFYGKVGEKPLSLRVRVQPRSIRLRSKRFDDGIFNIMLYFNNAGYEFKYSRGTIELRRKFERDPVLSQLLSEMTTTEFVVMSALLNDMVTSRESEGGQIIFLEVTSEGQKVRRVFQPSTMPEPQVTDPICSSPGVTETMQQPEATNMHTQ